MIRASLGLRVVSFVPRIGSANAAGQLGDSIPIRQQSPVVPIVQIAKQQPAQMSRMADAGVHHRSRKSQQNRVQVIDHVKQ